MEQAEGSITELVRGGRTEADDMSCSAHNAGTFRAAGGPRKLSGVRMPWPAGRATGQHCFCAHAHLKRRQHIQRYRISGWQAVRA